MSSPPKYCEVDINTQDCGVYVRCFGVVGEDGKCRECGFQYEIERPPVPPPEWMAEFRRLAVEDWGFTQEQADNSMPQNWARFYGRGLTPREALEEAHVDDV